MITRVLRTGLFLSMTAVLTLVSAVVAAPRASAETLIISETMAREQVFVQACDGFNAVSSYEATHDYRIVNEPSGRLVFEQRHTRFAGTAANSVTGRSFPYDGEYTRTANIDAGTIAVTGLVLRLGVPGESPLTVTIDRQERDLTDSPPALLLALAPHDVSAGLCNVLNGQPVVDPMGVLDLFLPGTSADETEEAPSTGAPSEICQTYRPGLPC